MARKTKPDQSNGNVERVTFVKATQDTPTPEPPSAGSWSRDPATGDLTLVQAAAQARTEPRVDPTGALHREPAAPRTPNPNTTEE